MHVSYGKLYDVDVDMKMPGCRTRRKGERHLVMSDQKSPWQPSPWIRPLLALVIVTEAFHGCAGDLCSDYNTQPLDDILFKAATPKGGIYAGKYTKDILASTLQMCVVSCCKSDTCHVVFFHDDLCFHIECNATNPDACQPEERHGMKFANTYMVLVQDPVGEEPSSDEESPSDVLTSLLSTTPDLLEDVELESECDPEGDDCPENEICSLGFSGERLSVALVCKCDEGYERESTTGICVEESRLHNDVREEDTRPTYRPSDTSCVYGLLMQCERNEECVQRNNRARSGHCTCVDGFEPDPETGWCMSKELEEDVTDSSEEPSYISSQKKNDHTTKIPSTTTTHHSSDKSTTMSDSSDGDDGDPIVDDTSQNVNTSSTSTSTTSTPSSTTPPLETLVVSAGDEKVLQLPEDSVTLSAYALPADETGSYKYTWTLIQHPEGEEFGQMEDSSTSTFKLSNLIAGLYTFKVAVTGDGKYGETFVNVTVLPPLRNNESPVAVIRPAYQEVRQPNVGVLDGSESTDDDKISTYHWEQISGPLNSAKLDEDDLNRKTLILKELMPGTYTFKLTVTDSDGAENSTTADIKVIKEVDYPPKANAGSNIIISLPQNSVTLYGNSSTDDKEIVSYEWIKNTDDKLTADMTGTRTPVLQLEHLEVGDYSFTLKVTDSSGQVSTADVHVFVNPENNKPPVARSGINKVVWLPTTSVTLDGSNSTDDQKISSYTWIQVSGPASSSVENADRAVATASNLIAGEYKFKLTVSDVENLQASSIITITVKENENHAPVADAGDDKIITLPTKLVSLDGSNSEDDKEIVSYEWKRDDNSLAAGDILNNSDHRAVLQLANLVAGRYIFTLTVVDAEGLLGTDQTSLIVKPDDHQNDLVELALGTEIGSFTQANKRNLHDQLAMLLHQPQQPSDTEVVIQQLRPEKNHLVVEFYALNDAKDSGQESLHGVEVVSSLRTKITNNPDVLDFPVISLDTVVCQNNCSDHGYCESSTKHCICEAFWMENIFKVYLGDGQSNCDWSILYVIIVAFVLLVTLAGIMWGLICLCRRWYRWRPKKRHRYTLLGELNEDDKVEMLPRGKIQNSSLMVSESDFSSDEETIFVNKKANGHLKNGHVRPVKNNKVKT